MSTDSNLLMESGPKPWPLPSSSSNDKPTTKGETAPLRKTDKMQGEFSSSQARTSPKTGRDDDKSADFSQNRGIDVSKVDRPLNNETGNRKDIKASDDLAEPIAMYSSARPVVLPIQKKFAPIDEGDVQFRFPPCLKFL